MCCRYAISETVLARFPSFRHPGDIGPADKAPALVAGVGVPVATALVWGFERTGRKLVINARSETAWGKPLFSAAAACRRCVLPAAWFYEWDRRKRRNTFYAADGGILFLAGLFNEVGRFIILTTEADGAMRPVHDRMPVCIPEYRIQDWLADAAAAREVLHKPRVALRREMPAGQATLW